MSTTHVYRPEWGDGSPCSICAEPKQDHIIITSRGDQDLKDKTTLAADAVLSYLEGLGGFDHWWDSVGRPIQRQIRRRIITEINKAITA